jgi:glutathione S-transferase
MSDELVFYTHPMSRGRIVRWMLEEVGQPYETRVMDYATTLKAPEYLAINPMGKIPAIRHGEAVVTETAAICAYLADAFPQAGLAPPPGDPRRAPYYRWLLFGAGPVESVVVSTALGVQVKPEQKRLVGWGDAADTLNVLEAAVSERMQSRPAAVRAREIDDKLLAA